MTAVADRWYSSPDALAILSQPDDHYGEELAAKNIANFAKVRALSPLPTYPDAAHADLDQRFDSAIAALRDALPHEDEPVTDQQQCDDYLAYQARTDPFMQVED